ncbi:MAG: SRPBCC domain-containing protein [Flammeovirgaceae bacterium]|nr:MAG: SRPBCC domain-containing protein [Flammeovirgaceae bacterium]
METAAKTTITVQATINAPVEKVWPLWTLPQHVTRWNKASDDWHTPHAENDLRVGGKFLSRMAARDGSMSFDFTGIYTRVDEHRKIDYTMSDGRKVSVTFAPNGDYTSVSETFETESVHSIEMQRAGWQAILDNFKKYVELSSKFERLVFETTINAPAEKVYHTMLDDKTYRKWTAEFNPTSHYKGNWVKGTKILFIGTNQEGKTEGIVSRVAELIPNKYVSLEHYGMVSDGNEITSGPGVDEWAGSREDYSFTEANGKTIVKVEMDSNAQFKDYFTEAWPRALKKLKAICEAASNN